MTLAAQERLDNVALLPGGREGSDQANVYVPVPPVGLAFRVTGCVTSAGFGVAESAPVLGIPFTVCVTGTD